MPALGDPLTERRWERDLTTAGCRLNWMMRGKPLDKGPHQSYGAARLAGISHQPHRPFCSWLCCGGKKEPRESLRWVLLWEVCVQGDACQVEERMLSGGSVKMQEGLWLRQEGKWRNVAVEEDVGKWDYDSGWRGGSGMRVGLWQLRQEDRKGSTEA